MGNKGLFKVFSSKRHFFVLGRYSWDLTVCFTLSQFGVGWAKFDRHLRIYIGFIDVYFFYIKCRDKKTARKIHLERSSLYKKDNQ